MLCRDVINGALRKLGRLGAGREPRVADQTDALTALKGCYAALIADGTFGRIQDIAPTGVTFTAGKAWHVFRDSPATLSVELPTGTADEIYSGCDYGSRWVSPAMTDPVRAVRDCTIVRITDDATGTTKDFLFDGDFRAWVTIDDLTLDDDAPLSRRNGEGLRAHLATKISDEFGADVGPSTAMLARQFVGQLAQGWSRPRTQVVAEYC